MATFNQYIRIYRFNDRVLTYNTINGRIIILSKDVVEGNSLSNNLTNSVKEYLYINDFLDKKLPWKKFEERFESNNRLLISLETFLACNLTCPYCYQINNNHLKASISSNNLDLLYDYITTVYNKVHFDILILKILGGEPSINWFPADYLLQKVIPFCKNNKVRLDLRVDTNGTDISQLVSLSGYDSILFTIPLCNKKQHDRYRHYRNGKGTYDDIIKNVITLEELPNCHIVLRHNTDSYNIISFDEYVSDIRNKGIHKSSIIPQYTTNPDYGIYRNKLTYQEYVDWVSSQYIDIVIKHKFKVPVYPRMLLDGKCQQWSNYSLKLFSDGKVGACAAHFFDKNNPFLSDIMNDGIDSIKHHWNGAKKISLFNDEKCRNCSSFFGCSGHYKLPCIKELKISQCHPEENLYLNWPLYFQTVYKHIEAGDKDFFQGVSIIIV